MAEECVYYYYDSGYSCQIKREQEGDSSINSETVYRYCWGYQYEECPRYKRAGYSSGGCYLTSACVEARGLADDCRELTVLRHFRDTYLPTTPTGARDVCEYYHTAPVIVERIKEGENPEAVFDKIYEELVAPCVSLIDAGKLSEAYEKYKSYTGKLQKQYL